MCMCQIVICGLPCSAVFFHIISQTDNFRNKVLEHECVFWFSLKLCLKRLSLNIILSGREPRQVVKVLQRFMHRLHPYLQGVADALVKITMPSATLWRWGRSQSMKRWRNFTLWRGCLPEKIILNSCHCESFKTKHSSFLEQLTDTWSKKLHSSSYKVPVILVRF